MSEVYERGRGWNREGESDGQEPDGGNAVAQDKS